MELKQFNKIYQEFQQFNHIKQRLEKLESLIYDTKNPVELLVGEFFILLQIQEKQFFSGQFPKIEIYRKKTWDIYNWIQANYERKMAVLNQWDKLAYSRLRWRREFQETQEGTAIPIKVEYQTKPTHKIE